MDKLTTYLDHCANDLKERYQKALKIVGKKDFTYSKVELDSFDEVTSMAVVSGFGNIPKKYQEDPELDIWFKYGIAPYALIEQGGLLIWLVVRSNADFEMRDSRRVDELTLPRQITSEEFWADVEVYNFDHPDFGYDSASVNVVAEKHGFVRVK